MVNWEDRLRNKNLKNQSKVLAKGMIFKSAGVLFMRVK